MRHPPKSIEQIAALFPFVHFLASLFSFIFMLKENAMLGFVLFLFVLYLLPPAIWFFVRHFFHLKNGPQFIGKKVTQGNLWVISFHLQGLYSHFPFIERILMIIPESYSAWLRLWGSKVGKKVLWTPDSKVVDRPFVTIGDRTLIGNMSYLSSHVIKKTKGKYLLYFKPVVIGSDVVIGFHATLGPGCVIEDNAIINAGVAIYPNQIVKKEDKHEYDNDFFKL